MEGGNEGANILFGTVDALFDTVDREGVGNKKGANLLLLPPLWSALPGPAPRGRKDGGGEKQSGVEKTKTAEVTGLRKVNEGTDGEG